MHRLALLAVVFATSSVAAAPCAIIENRPVVLTAKDATIDDGGGIVVGTMPDFQHTNTSDSADFRFADKSKPTIKHIAPGLDVLLTTGAATLQDTAHKRLVSVKHGKVAEASAPMVKSIIRFAPHVKHSYVTVNAELTSAVPAGAIALVVFDKAGTTARSWGVASPNGAAFTVYQNGSCALQVANTADSNAGDEIRLAWLDSSGRLSKLSAPVAVVAAPDSVH